VTTEGETIRVRIGDRSCTLSRADAVDLQAAIGDAVTDRREFFRTAGEYRDDGSYVVSRRGADSTGNAKVFESFETLRRLFDRLPATFDAEDVGRAGITGSRRHMLIRHVAEHPAFDCEIGSRNPLRGRKTSSSATGDENVETDEIADTDADLGEPLSEGVESVESAESVESEATAD
jgi:hypothetical protein